MNDERPAAGNDGSTDPWESEMSREFDKRVRDLHEAPLTFDNVKGKAMTIRRHRRIAVAGGILAAAAVVVPIAVIAGNGFGDTKDNIDPIVSPSPTKTTDPNDPSPTTEAPPDPVLGVSYLEGSTWHRADGSTVELDEEYFSGVALGDQLVATSNANGKLKVDVIDADGSVADSFKTISYPVVNDDHTTIAYVATDGSLMTRWEDGEVGMGEGFVDGDTVAALTGGPNCNEEVDGCVLFVNHGNGSAPELLSSHGIRDLVTPRAIKVNDTADSGLVAAQYSFSDTGSCSEVFDSSKGANVFETCDARFFAFSPDASHLTGSDPYGDGIGLGYVSVFDATNGQEVTRFTPKDGFVRESVWEDAGHVLVNTYEQGEWRVYRLGVDGTSELVVSSTEGDDVTPAFTLLGGS
jgi:hypothetical protein